MGWETEISVAFEEYRHQNLGGAERKLLDSYLGNWVYRATPMTAFIVILTVIVIVIFIVIVKLLL